MEYFLSAKTLFILKRYDIAKCFLNTDSGYERAVPYKGMK